MISKYCRFNLRLRLGHLLTTLLILGLGSSLILAGLFSLSGLQTISPALSNRPSRLALASQALDLVALSIAPILDIFGNPSETVFPATVITGPDLIINKGDSGVTAEPGQNIVYTLIYNNDGQIAASNVVITETVPANTTFNKGESTSGWKCKPNNSASSTCTLTKGEVPAAKGEVVKFVVTVDDSLPANVEIITNTVRIGDDGKNGPDPKPDNNNDNETTPTVYAPTPAPTEMIYFPIIAKNLVAAPDLVVENLTASSTAITVTIKNQGNTPVVDAFWVDVYINPITTPIGVNQRWLDLGDQGLTWGVTDLPITPGTTLTLTIEDTAFREDLSNFETPLAVGSTVYAQVDSVNFSTDYGGVLESHEIITGAYNNIISTISTLRK